MLPHENLKIGCIMLAEPFFWLKDAWIRGSEDFRLNTVQAPPPTPAAYLASSHLEASCTKRVWEKAAA